MGKPDVGRGEMLVVGNYLPDGQESMLRFARMLVDGLCTQGVPVRLVTPGAWFERLWKGTSGPGKWLAYLDKYVIFPWLLRQWVRGLGPDAIVHITDHSNAVYARAAASAGHRVLVTCHDLGAVRGALGEDTKCPASRMGRLLQRWIARSLGEADGIVCVSEATRRDVERLIRRENGSKVPTWVVLNGLNVPYRKWEVGSGKSEEGGQNAEVESGGWEGAPFVLNVGSSLSRKNRDGVLRIFAQIADRWPGGRMVLAGEGMTEECRELARELGVSERVVEVVKPPDAELEALYNRALCLLFPSKFEGFGWPAVEAQACGCPVLCSDAGALGEVVKDSAFVRGAGEEGAFAEEIWRLINDKDARDRWSELGLRNAERFSAETMLGEYGKIYAEIRERAAGREKVGVGQ